MHFQQNIALENTTSYFSQIFNLQSVSITFRLRCCEARHAFLNVFAVPEKDLEKSSEQYG